MNVIDAVYGRFGNSGHSDHCSSLATAFITIEQDISGWKMRHTNLASV